MKASWPNIAAMVVIIALVVGGLGYYGYQHRDALKSTPTSSTSSTEETSEPPVDEPPVEDPEPPEEDCNPNYDPCIPNTYDLDCDEISGSVTVTGTDEYGLDGDGDGTGCDLN